ncbi:MAG: hypothetical protein P8Y94_12615, partial [Acidobacteriota bacterium]
SMLYDLTAIDERARSHREGQPDSIEKGWTSFSFKNRSSCGASSRPIQTVGILSRVSWLASIDSPNCFSSSLTTELTMIDL